MHVTAPRQNSLFISRNPATLPTISVLIVLGYTISSRLLQSQVLTHYLIQELTGIYIHAQAHARPWPSRTTNQGIILTCQLAFLSELCHLPERNRFSHYRENG
jgi:hypothetical protein